MIIAGYYRFTFLFLIILFSAERCPNFAGKSSDDTTNSIESNCKLCVSFKEQFICKYLLSYHLPALVRQSDVHLTGDQEVAGSILDGTG